MTEPHPSVSPTELLGRIGTMSFGAIAAVVGSQALGFALPDIH